MATLPATGTKTGMGRAHRAYTSTTLGTQGKSSFLNAQISRGNISTAGSTTFGGRTTPFTYY